MRLLRSYPTYRDYQRAILFKNFSLLVDAIDFHRLQLPEEDRVRSPKLDQKYREVDGMIVKLKRLGPL